MIRRLGILAIALLIAVPAFAAGPVPFEDVNNNGVFDAGDKDLTADLTLGMCEETDSKGKIIRVQCQRILLVRSDQSIVIPAGAVVLGSAEYGVYLVAQKNITVNGYISTGPYASIQLTSLAGDVTIGPGATLKGISWVELRAMAGTITAGVGSHFFATGSSGNAGRVNFRGKSVVLGDQVNVRASDDGIGIYGTDSVKIGAAFILTSGYGDLGIGAPVITIGKAKLQGRGVLISANPGALTMVNSWVVSPKDQWCNLLGNPATLTGVRKPVWCEVGR